MKLRQRYNLVAAILLILGMAALVSATVYAIAGVSWWVEIPRYDDVERGVLLAAGHVALIVAGVVSLFYFIDNK